MGKILYAKGVIGHVTIDLISFPHPTDPNAYPLYWAVDISTDLSDYSAACIYFDILMDGEYSESAGEYFIEIMERA